MIDPRAAQRNYARLAEIGGERAIRLLRGARFHPLAIAGRQRLLLIRNYMAHHQGMTIVAIANVLHEGKCASGSTREPMIKASELLLAGAPPREVAVPRATR